MKLSFLENICFPTVLGIKPDSLTDLTGPVDGRLGGSVR